MFSSPFLDKFTYTFRHSFLYIFSRYGVWMAYIIAYCFYSLRIAKIISSYAIALKFEQDHWIIRWIRLMSINGNFYQGRIEDAKTQLQENISTFFLPILPNLTRGVNSDSDHLHVLNTRLTKTNCGKREKWWQNNVIPLYIREITVTSETQ